MVGCYLWVYLVELKGATSCALHEVPQTCERQSDGWLQVLPQSVIGNMSHEPW